VLANSTFESQMPPIKGGIGIAVVVRIGMVLELGLTESHMFVWVMIRVGGGTNGPPFGLLMWPLIEVFADGKTVMVSDEVRLIFLF
jgi:hypothetical protein